ncbi:cytochrome b/b6 domain-containing protein [Variovorax terrae]|uniref:Cytochrome b/b6 domain-containing protein n=1 Tax=Variovorax terrae TaxID=2923278 RepID=A0A9X1W1X1_9BURK|nr:cytochrome b/b6 domain-containing protein [Variovorax terrae]MCJ0764588.1 cytochrome b/b6 domain-containing protein [Variovorax terrae]
MSNKVRVWDLPTRIFHWALAACVIALAITAYAGGNAMVWHFRFGYAVLSLLLFRLVWGLVGGRWSRFASFLYSPAAIGSYLRGRSHPDHLVGHNPLGAASVFALLIFLCAQVGTGLFSDDEIAFAGPLTRFVSGATVSQATWYHKAVGQWVLLALVLLHVAAILFYLVKKKENLVRAMIVGDKEVPRPVPSSRDDAASRLMAAILLAACAAGVGWLVGLGG